MTMPLVDEVMEEKLVTLKDVSWEQFKGIEAHLYENRNLSNLSAIQLTNNSYSQTISIFKTKPSKTSSPDNSWGNSNISTG